MHIKKNIQHSTNVKHAITLTISLFLIGGYLTTKPAHALTLSAPPTPSDEADAQTIYQPIKKLLKRNVGELSDLELSTEATWGRFSKQLLRKQYDVLISGPHITAFASNYQAGLKMRVIARFPDQTSYHLVVKMDSPIKTIKDLEQKRICMRPAPHYGNILISQLFTNPVTIPSSLSINKSDGVLLQQLDKKRCHAAVIEHRTFKAFPKESGLRSLHQTQPAYRLGISVSEKIQAETRDKIVSQLQSLDLSKIDPRYDSSQKITAADNPDFEPYRALAGILWGW